MGVARDVSLFECDASGCDAQARVSRESPLYKDPAPPPEWATVFIGESTPPLFVYCPAHWREMKRSAVLLEVAAHPSEKR